MNQHDPQELVSGFFDEVWNKGNLGFIDEYYAPDFVLHALWQNTSLGGSGEAAGAELAKQVVARWRDALPDMYMTIEEQFLDGDTVVTRHRSGGTQTREFQGIPPTGRHAEISGITITRVADGKIMEAWTCWDALSMLQQLGVIPKPGGPGGPGGANGASGNGHA